MDANGEVSYVNTGSTATVSTRTGLFGDSRKRMQTRLLYGAICVLSVIVVGLVITLAVVASKTTGSNGAETPVTGCQAGGAWDLPEVDCSHAISDLDKAKCVFDSFPLIDGYEDTNIYYYYLYVFCSIVLVKPSVRNYYHICNKQNLNKCV
ncbi:hypothetical protein DPMN_136425 [Dreissena polymorpha]|uniref:Uncharacterized protein n=1 Tax=Dreissena polymorpha TaxID=45954 RepID=A0A9D4G3B9_DREPO|nr:hypothetical protein DPMN_136425 [Dreissena polymorpha]